MVAFLLFQPTSNVAADTGSGSDVAGALQNAARQTGAGFDYLLRTAMQESSMQPDAQAGTSSATGWVKCIEATWLQTVKSDGARFGLQNFADEIEAAPSGRFTVANAQARADILALRNDPGISALMAGALAEGNANSLQSSLGRAPSDGELYIAHFLGAQGAGHLIGLAETRPGANAPQSFPDAAHANRAIFYNRDGTPRSVSEVYNVLVRKHEAADAPAREALNVTAAQPRPRPITSLFEGLFRAIVGGPAAESGQALSYSQNSGRSLFTTDPESAQPLPGPASGAPMDLDAIRNAQDANRAYQRHADWNAANRRWDDPASWI